MKQRDFEKIKYSIPAARKLADELAADPQQAATAQGYIGKLQSEKERELVFLIYRDLSNNHVCQDFWHRLQTAAMLRQRYAHFRADILAQVNDERQQAIEARKKKKTVMDKLLEHKQELLDLSEQGLSSSDIAKYMHRAHRSQFPQHGSPHYKSVQKALQQIRGELLSLQ